MLYKYVYINIYNVMAGLLLYYNHATIMQRHRNLHKMPCDHTNITLGKIPACLGKILS